LSAISQKWQEPSTSTTTITGLSLATRELVHSVRECTGSSIYTERVRAHSKHYGGNAVLFAISLLRNLVLLSTQSTFKPGSSFQLILCAATLFAGLHTGMTACRWREEAFSSRYSHLGVLISQRWRLASLIFEELMCQCCGQPDSRASLRSAQPRNLTLKGLSLERVWTRSNEGGTGAHLVDHNRRNGSIRRSLHVNDV